MVVDSDVLQPPSETSTVRQKVALFESAASALHWSPVRQKVALFERTTAAASSSSSSRKNRVLGCPTSPPQHRPSFQRTGSLVRRRQESLLQLHRQHRSTRELTSSQSDPDDGNKNQSVADDSSDVPDDDETAAAAATKRAMACLVRRRHESLMQQYRQHQSTRELGGMRTTTTTAVEAPGGSNNNRNTAGPPSAAATVGPAVVHYTMAKRAMESLVKRRHESLLQQQNHRQQHLFTSKDLWEPTAPAAGRCEENTAASESGAVGVVVDTTVAKRAMASHIRRRHESLLLQQHRQHQSARELRGAVGKSPLSRVTKRINAALESTVTVQKVTSESVAGEESRNDDRRHHQLLLLTKTFHQNSGDEAREPAEQQRFLVSSEADSIMMAIDNNPKLYFI